MSKRKKVVLSIEKKLEAMIRLDQGETLKNIAKDLGVGRVTVGDWKRKRRELEAWYIQKPSGSGHGERKTMKKSVFENVGEALFQWYNIQCEKGISISGPTLQVKALLLHDKFNPGKEDQFSASNGWLDRWKNRYGVRQLSMKIEKEFSDEECKYRFIDQFTEYITMENLKKDQIYCCYETTLNFKMLPKKIFTSNEEDLVSELINSKERVTLFLCNNASGTHRLPLICIGKSIKPEKLKNNLSIPVKYKYHKSGWMDQEIFKTWYVEDFIPCVRKFLEQSGLPKKAVLIMDNISCHSCPEELQTESIKVFSYPTDEIHSVQGMNLCVIESFKLRYRYRLLLSFLLGSQDRSEIVQQHFLLRPNIDGQKTVEYFSKFTIIDMVNLVASAWYDVQSISFSKCWRNILSEFIEKEEEDEEQNENMFNLIQGLPGCENLTQGDILEWIRTDHIDDITLEDIVAKIVSNITNQPDINNSLDIEIKEEPISSRMFNNISHNEAALALQTALQYVQQQETVTSRDISVLKKWRDFAVKHL